MADDPFQDLLELEDEFYKEGFEAGVADSTYAGMIEGKVFGVEKGYEKALELAKLHGRATVWNARISGSPFMSGLNDGATTTAPNIGSLSQQLDKLLFNSRLQKHIETLSALTDGTTMETDNSDEAVTEFDDRIAKARAKAKVIANIVGEPLNLSAAAVSSIEDATGLNARH